MLKKISVAFAASAFAMTIAVPAALACGHKSEEKTVEQKQEKQGEIASKDKAGKSEAPKSEKSEKSEKAKQPQKPVKVSSK